MTDLIYAEERLQYEEQVRPFNQESESDLDGILQSKEYVEFTL